MDVYAKGRESRNIIFGIQLFYNVSFITVGWMVDLMIPILLKDVS